MRSELVKFYIVSLLGVRCVFCVFYLVPLNFDEPSSMFNGTITKKIISLVMVLQMLQFIFSIFKKNKGLKLPPEDELDYGEIYPDNDNDVPVKKSRVFIFD